MPYGTGFAFSPDSHDGRDLTYATGAGALCEKALLVHERLCAEYHCPIGYFHSLDPLSELVSSLLSHRARNADSARAYRELRRRFLTWEAVRDAEVSDLEAAIAAATCARQPRGDNAPRPAVLLLA